MPRNKSVTHDCISIVDLPCLVVGSGYRARSVPIPTVKEGGATCVAINPTDNWISKVFGDKGRADGQLVIKEFVDGLWAKLSGEEDTPAQPSKGIEGQGASSGGDQGASSVGCVGRGRGAMGLDSDSEEGALGAAWAESQGGSSAKKRRTRAPRAVWETVQYRDLELVVKQRERGRGVAVPVEGPTLLRILVHMREAVLAGEQPQPDVEKK